MSPQVIKKTSVMGIIGVMLVGCIGIYFINVVLMGSSTTDSSLIRDALTSNALFSFMVGGGVLGLSLLAVRYFASRNSDAMSNEMTEGDQQVALAPLGAQEAIAANDHHLPSVLGVGQSSVVQVPPAIEEHTPVSQSFEHSRENLAEVAQRVDAMMTMIEEIAVKTQSLTQEVSIEAARVQEQMNNGQPVVFYDFKNLKMRTSGQNQQVLATLPKAQFVQDQDRSVVDAEYTSADQPLVSQEPNNLVQKTLVNAQGAVSVQTSTDTINTQMHDLQDAMQNFLKGVRKNIAAM